MSITFISPNDNACLETIRNVCQERRKINENTLVSLGTYSNRNDLACLNSPLYLFQLPKIDYEDNKEKPFFDNVCALIHRFIKYQDKIVNRQTQTVIIFSNIPIVASYETSRLTGSKEMFYQLLQTKLLGWRFIFVGVDDISMKVAKAMGFNVCIKYNANNTKPLEEVILDVLKYELDERKPQEFSVDLTK